MTKHYKVSASGIGEHYMLCLDQYFFQMLYTNQYSVTKHSKMSKSSMGEQSLPGVFVMYELSPMMVKYTEKQR